MKHEIEFTFSKRGKLRMISHLDLMRLFMRALRRASVPVGISQGFNPHPKLSIARALKVGMESGAETARVELRETLTPQEFLKGLNEQLPEGIRVTSASIR